jgi:hypothetical protein
MNLLQSGLSGLPIGTVLMMAGPPNFQWVKCDGSVYAQSDYLSYVNGAMDIHPNRWAKFSYIGFPNGGGGAISKMGNTIVVTPYNGRDVYYSTDNGDTWQTAVNALPATGRWTLLTNNGTTFVALRSSTTQAAYSTDGITWNYSNAFPGGASAGWDWIGWNGQIFATTYTGNYAQTIYYSADGITWSAGYTFAANCWPKGMSRVGDSNNKFLVYHQNQVTLARKVCRIGTGTTLEEVIDYPFGAASEADGFIPRLNGYFWMFDDVGSEFFYRSTDGASWEQFWGGYAQDIYWSSGFWPAPACLWTGEDYLLFNYNGGDPSYLVLHGTHLNSSARLDPTSGIYDAVFLSKEKGCIILYRNDADTSGYTRVARLSFSEYDYTTHFQVPYRIPPAPGCFFYIKVK